ncbi:hypothetical protein PR001_g16679 [Phytophthora rubi]|uniref:Retrotransposon gag domain-containing protein n=1 Tax=Phytophthora rubi TaxID=129364 RepID=A0A6A3KM84_9STRA|nr:hypothetical protein PR001_g16679 [Phytophthora rubi]
MSPRVAWRSDRKVTSAGSHRWGNLSQPLRAKEEEKKKMARGTKSVAPTTPMKSSGPGSEASDHYGSSFESLATVAMDRVDEHPATYDSALEPSDAMEDDEDDDWEVKGTVTEAAEAAVVSAGRSSGVRPLPETSLTSSTTSPNQSQLSARTTEKMYPSTMALADWSPTEAATALSKWKKKLRAAFGATTAGVAHLVFGGITFPATTETDPSRVPLPLTPQKGVNEVKSGTFAAKEKRFEAREESSDSDEDRFDPDYYDGDQTGEWARQVRELSAANGRSNTPRLEIATHLPLGNIKPFLGTRNKSERSMQWLRKFMYEMKGTHTPTNEWCMAFELNLQDGALHWYRQLPRKTKRTWKLLSDAFIKYYCSKFTQSAKARYYSAKREDKEHVCDYLNRLNGYARNAGVQFENGGREAKDHVDHLLDTCDDRGLEERLCHARVKDIHDLEEMINDILRSRERKTAREPSLRRYRSQDDDRRRESRSNEGTRSSFGRERRYRDDGRRRERRDESPHRSTITLVEALADVVTALNIRASAGDREDSPSAHGYGRDATEAAGQRDTSYDDEEYSDAESDSSEVSADAHGMSTRRTTTSAERLRQGPSLGQTIVVSRVGVTNSSVTERDVVSTDRAQHATAPTIRCTTATGGASCVNKCTMSANVMPSGS